MTCRRSHLHIIVLLLLLLLLRLLLLFIVMVVVIADFSVALFTVVVPFPVVAVIAQIFFTSPSYIRLVVIIVVIVAFSVVVVIIIRLLSLFQSHSCVLVVFHGAKRVSWRARAFAHVYMRACADRPVCV